MTVVRAQKIIFLRAAPHDFFLQSRDELTAWWDKLGLVPEDKYSALHYWPNGTCEEVSIVLYKIPEVL
jgi:hypothetical protein